MVPTWRSNQPGLATGETVPVAGGPGGYEFAYLMGMVRGRLIVE